MTSRSVGSSGSTIYAYDGQNRLASVTYPGSTPSVTKSYTRTHRLKTVVTSVASRLFDYDANDNLRAETINVDNHSFNIGYTYNGNDQLSVLVYPRSSASVS